MHIISGNPPIIPYQSVDQGLADSDGPVSTAADIFNLIKGSLASGAVEIFSEFQAGLTGALTALGSFVPETQQDSLNALIGQLSSQTTYSGLSEVMNGVSASSLPQVNFYSGPSSSMTTDQMITSMLSRCALPGAVSYQDMGYLVQCLLYRPAAPTGDTQILQSMFGINTNLPCFVFSGRMDNDAAMCMQTLLSQWQGAPVQASLLAWMSSPSNIGHFMTSILEGPIGSLDQIEPSTSQLSQLKDLWQGCLTILTSIPVPISQVLPESVTLALDRLTFDITQTIPGNEVSTSQIQADWATLQSLLT